MVTWPEEALASRVAASLLAAGGLGALVARSADDYVDLAAAMAHRHRPTRLVWVRDAAWRDVRR